MTAVTDSRTQRIRDGAARLRIRRPRILFHRPRNAVFVHRGVWQRWVRCARRLLAKHRSLAWRPPAAFLVFRRPWQAGEASAAAGMPAARPRFLFQPSIVLSLKCVDLRRFHMPNESRSTGANEPRLSRFHRRAHSCASVVHARPPAATAWTAIRSAPVLRAADRNLIARRRAVAPASSQPVHLTLLVRPMAASRAARERGRRPLASHQCEDSVHANPWTALSARVTTTTRRSEESPVPIPMQARRAGDSVRSEVRQRPIEDEPPQGRTRTTTAQLRLPEIDIAAVTDRVVRQIDRRMTAWRERTGRI